MTFSYTVTNQGSNDAVGQWTDALYLSPTTSFVYTDPLLATNVHQGGLAAGQSYTDQVTAHGAGRHAGDVLRDPPHRRPATRSPSRTWSNNVSASLSSVSINAPALTLGTPPTGTLGQGQSAYYKVS